MAQKRVLSAKGFTLLEIMVVLFLISLVAIIIGPKLSLKHASGLQKTTRILVREIRELQWEAISSQRMVRLDYNLNRGRISASIIAPSGNLSSLIAPGIRDFKVSKGVRIDEIRVLHQGKVHDGKTFTQFFASGAVEPTTILLTDLRGKQITIVIRSLTGRVRVVKGAFQETPPPPFYGIPSGEIPSMERSGDE